eukprot:GILJ01009715.1.p1 GENE.GILJ01009715.1~~GILJ01009715.1.p1  ORF type:complete len:715 (-),score=96.03 GILJ01009715.1:474-2618(-)
MDPSDAVVKGVRHRCLSTLDLGAAAQDDKADTSALATSRNGNSDALRKSLSTISYAAPDYDLKDLQELKKEVHALRSGRIKAVGLHSPMLHPRRLAALQLPLRQDDATVGTNVARYSDNSIFNMPDLMHIVERHGRETLEGEKAENKRKLDEIGVEKFVIDRPLKHSQDKVLESFSKLVQKGSILSPEQLRIFFEENFSDYSSDLIPVFPADWCPFPKFVTAIDDPQMRLWAKQLNAMWPSLCRKVSDSVKQDFSKYSLIDVEHPMVVPGGRFMEMYYWDTWWSLRGLLTCEMFDTSKGIIDNMCSLVNRFGFIPNGTRRYYLNRSQPPVLSEMIMSYITTTKDESRLAQWTKSLDSEYNFWMTKRVVQVRDPDSGEIYLMNRFYADNITGPRPESYVADMEFARGLAKERWAQFFTDIAAACESGWDFSSRWCENYKTLDTCITSRLIVVDLNCILYRMEKNLAMLHAKLGEMPEAQAYRAAANRRMAALNRICWNEEKAQWFDYDIGCNAQRTGVFLSNFFPLWAGCYDERDVNLKQRVLAAFKSSGLIGNAGLQTSPYNSGLQWDAPNAWAPLQDIIITGLNKMQLPEARALAQETSARWLLSNFMGWKKNLSFEMHEKYDVTQVGARGEGGEYLPQIGFGWTNGVVLSLLETYGCLFNTAYLRSMLLSMLQCDIEWQNDSTGQTLFSCPAHLRPLFKFDFFVAHSSSRTY